MSMTVQDRDGHAAMRFVATSFVVFCIFLLASCVGPRSVYDPQQAFFDKLSALCGKAYSGKLVSSDAADAGMLQKPMIMHVRECDTQTIRIPFHVADDRSRTWVVERTAFGLRLKHDHRHEDGNEDAVSWYGGETRNRGTVTRQEFSVDTQSVDMFRKEGLDASVTNIWTLELTDRIFAYQLSRENRLFRVEFDITRPIETPLPPWGVD